MDGVLVDGDVSKCLVYDDTLCAESGCYDAFSLTAACETAEVCDANAASSAGLLIAVIVCLLAAVAVGVLVYCLCCKSSDDADNEYKQSQ